MASVKDIAELRVELKKLDGLGRLDSERGGRLDLSNVREFARLYDRLELLEPSGIEALIRECAREESMQPELASLGLEMLFTALFDKNPESAWKLVETLSKIDKHSLRQIVMISLAEKSPETAIAKCEGLREAAVEIFKLPPGETRNLAVRLIAEAWLKVTDDPNEPYKWLTSQKETYHDALGEFIRGWAHRDIIAALEAWRKLPRETWNEHITPEFITWCSPKEMETILAWAAKLPDSKERQRFTRATIWEMCSKKPTRIIELLDSSGLSDDVKVISYAVDRWAINDDVAATAWVRELPDGEVKNSSLEKLANRVLYNGNPETAASLAMLISKPSLQASALTGIIQSWKKRDTKAAEAWIKKSKLPADVKKRLGKVKDDEDDE